MPVAARGAEPDQLLALDVATATFADALRAVTGLKRLAITNPLGRAAGSVVARVLRDAPPGLRSRRARMWACGVGGCSSW